MWCVLDCMLFSRTHACGRIMSIPSSPTSRVCIVALSSRLTLFARTLALFVTLRRRPTRSRASSSSAALPSNSDCGKPLTETDRGRNTDEFLQRAWKSVTHVVVGNSSAHGVACVFVRLGGRTTTHPFLYYLVRNILHEPSVFVIDRDMLLLSTVDW